MNNEKEKKQRAGLFKLGKNSTKKAVKSANNTRKYIVKKIAKKLGWSIGVVSFLSFIFIIIIAGVVFAIVNKNQSNNDLETGFKLSAEVENYTPVIRMYAEQFEILEYVPLIKAIMMQESAGQGTDPMQSSECPFNDKYPKKPDSIEEAGYSIQVGIEYLAYCLKEANAKGMEDIPAIKLSAQGYNYGNGYISWALNNYGGYSKENALEFSQMKKQELNLDNYGDPEYVPKVFKYLPNQSTSGTPHQKIIDIASQEVGNNYSKYGLYSDWCARFVSWCAKQANIPETEIKPYDSVWKGIQWFDSKGRFKESAYRGGNYTPNVGDIIFINWFGLLGLYDGNHTGLVAKVENGRVYTIEGNTNGYENMFWQSSVVSAQSYPLNSQVITGYGIYN